MKGVFEMDSLHVHGITLGYGKSVVLRDIDLEVKPGEMVGIIGPNGCGKSTLIKGITRLIAFRSEQIFINGHNVAKMSRGDLARVVAATHDLNLAAQYCDRLIMLSQQRIYCQGTPHQVINPQNIKQVYGAEVCVYPHPVNDLPATLIVAGKKEISEKAFDNQNLG